MTQPLSRCSIVMAGGDIVYGLDVHPDDITQADRWLEIETHNGPVWINPQHVSHFTERL